MKRQLFLHRIPVPAARMNLMMPDVELTENLEEQVYFRHRNSAASLEIFGTTNFAG